MRPTLARTAAAAAALAVTVTGCSPVPKTAERPAPAPAPVASAEPTRQDDARDAQLRVEVDGRCRFDADQYGTVQLARLVGTVKSPVSVAVVFSVRNSAGVPAGSKIHTIRLEETGKVSAPLTLLAEMTDAQWKRGFDVCTSQITWSTLADQ